MRAENQGWVRVVAKDYQKLVGLSHDMAIQTARFLDSVQGERMGDGDIQMPSEPTSDMINAALMVRRNGGSYQLWRAWNVMRAIAQQTPIAERNGWLQLPCHATKDMLDSAQLIFEQSGRRSLVWAYKKMCAKARPTSH